MGQYGFESVLVTVLALAATGACAQPRYAFDESELSFRVLLGSLDGEESASGLHNDSPRFTIGLSASSPVALGGMLAANLEIWLSERSYDTPALPPTLDTVSNTSELTVAAITYGLRLQPPRGALQPYAMAAVGFQGSRLRTRGTAGGQSLTAEEETVSPTAHLGVGIEWVTGGDSFGIDYRRWFAEGEFRDFGIADTGLGGDYLGLSLGTRW
jgi:hypothetical protein